LNDEGYYNERYGSTMKKMLIAIAILAAGAKTTDRIIKKRVKKDQDQDSPKKKRTLALHKCPLRSIPRIHEPVREAVRSETRGAVRVREFPFRIAR